MQENFFAPAPETGWLESSFYIQTRKGVSMELTLTPQDQAGARLAIPEAVFFVVIHSDANPHPCSVEVLTAFLERWQSLPDTKKEEYVSCIDASICTSSEEVLDHLSLLPKSTEIVLISDDPHNRVICSTASVSLLSEAFPSYAIWSAQVSTRTKTEKRITWAAGYITAIYGKKNRQNPPQGRRTARGTRIKTPREQRRFSRRSDRLVSMYF